MSTSKAIKPRRDDAPLGKLEPIPERAPSIEREDRPIVARVLAMIGLFLFVLGSLAMVATLWSRVTVITPDWGYRLASLGLVLILFHAFMERDFQFRRLYAFLGIGLLLAGVVLRLLAFRAAAAPDPDRFMRWFLLGGVPGMFIGLVLLVAVIRIETEASFRTLMLNLVGALGAMMIVFAMARGIVVPDYLAGEGVMLLVLGLLHVSAFIGLQDGSSETGYKAALALAATGGIGFLVGLIFSIVPAASIGRLPWNDFFVPTGLILMSVSLIYVVVAASILVDWPVIVLARRELATYFFSPVAYLVFVGQVIFAWIMFAIFVGDVAQSARDPRRGGMMEPIVINYILNIIPVFVQMFFVPALTMRLLSEEKRSGTLEVLLTAPVNETSVVLGKFIASWVFYMLLWLPWWMFLISLRYFGNEEFDYRPVLSFTIALAVISAGFMSMGLFCSALTSNQIIAAVFTFVGMMLHLAIYFCQGMPFFAGNAMGEVFAYVNFVDLWIESLRGTIAPRFLVFHTSLAIFFLFATVKVLGARRWS